MCGRLACTLCPDDIVKKCQYYNKEKELETPKWLDSQYEYKPVYNGPPSTVVPVMCHKQNFSDVTKNFPDYCVVPMRWGMLPPYKTEVVGNFHTHNARIEQVTNSTLYKPCLISGKRCVVLADGYYEWKTTQGENYKQPYFMYQAPQGEENTKDKYLIKLAGLFNIIRDNMGIKYTCTILTTESDSSLSWMHHRMPVILNTDEDIQSWLNCENKYEEVFQKLPKYSDFDKKFELKYYIVNKTFVNNTKCNEEKCMQRISNKRKSTTLDNWLKKAKK